MRGDNEEDDQLLAEIQDLREDFKEYANSTSQRRANRRVENIQVLIALTVVAGLISIYSSDIYEMDISQYIVQNPFWRIILGTFVLGNILFLILKLITIPIISISNNRVIAFFHDEFEPFLYLFAILAVLFGLVVRVLVSPIFHQVGESGQSLFAIIALIIPAFIGAIYSQIYYLNINFERSRDLFIEVDELSENLVKAGAISAEMQIELTNQVIKSITPTPALFFIANSILNSVTKFSTSTGNVMVNFFNSIAYTTSWIFTPINQTTFLFSSLTEVFLNEKQSEKTTQKEREELEKRIRCLRMKEKQGRLSEEDLEEFYVYLSELSNLDDSDGESDGDEMSRSDRN